MDHGMIVGVVIILGLLMLIIGLIEADAYPANPEIYQICSYTYEEPYYDCDTIWILYYYPTVTDVYELCHENKDFHMLVAGCAVYDDYRGHYMIIGDMINSKSHTGDMVLWHEIKHLRCICNFHGG